MVRPPHPYREGVRSVGVNVRRVRGSGVRTLALLEDIEWLVECGEWPERIADRVGRPREALQRVCYRQKRHDLVAALTIPADVCGYVEDVP